MSEPKYRRRIPPCPAYDIPAMESWLEDMASKGLHLSPDGFFLGFATFEEGPPRKERFRLEPTATQAGLFSSEYEPDDDQVQMLRQMGWTYRARRDQFHIYSASDPHAPELNTDPQVQAITMTALTKYLWKSLRSTLVLMLFYAFLYSGDLLITGSILVGTWRTVLLLALLLWDLGRRLRAVLVLTRYRKQLRSGEPLPHRTDYRSRDLLHLASGAVRRGLWVLLVASTLAFLLPMMAHEPYVPLGDQTFPFATLEDLYPGAEVRRMDGILKSQVYGWSDFLAPRSYDFTEYAEVTFEGETFDCYLTVQYFHTRWEWTARMASRELVRQAEGSWLDRAFARLFGNDPVEVTELALPDADYCCYFYSGLPNPYVIVRQNDVVLRVRYAPFSGAPELEPEELARIILSQIQ